MTVYLGSDGCVELKRSSSQPINATLGTADVNPERKRFSFDQDVSGELITGDHVDIRHKNPKDVLKFIEGFRANGWRGYINIDLLGGIRLYTTFEDAVAGRSSNAVPLEELDEKQDIIIQTRDSLYRQLAHVKAFEFTTERETIDTTTLTDEFRKRYESGLISGQGRLDCYWDHKYELCDPQITVGAELPVYLAQLCIRLVQGADFFGRFYIYTPGGPDLRSSETAVWYEADCIVTNVSVNVTAQEAIESSIDFVTTGKFKLLMGGLPSYVLTEEPAKLLQEDGSGILLSQLDQ